MGPNKTYKFCTAKETIKKKNLWDGRKYLQMMRPMRLNLQNIQTAHTTQQKKQKPNRKMGRRPKDTFPQRRHTEGQ